MTTIPLALDRPGVAIEQGDHICAFYRGRDQRDDVLLPFLRDGLVQGHKCIAVMDDPDVEQVTNPLSLVVDIESHLLTGQLELMSSDTAYLTDGHFSTERMLDFWESNVSEAVRPGGFPFVRSVGEMTWALRDMPGVDQLVRYEARLNRFLPRYPQVILCLYDLEQFTDGRILLEMLKTHPKVLMSGQVLDNPWYVEPEDDPLA
jgi:hypothetical protein